MSIDTGYAIHKKTCRCIDISVKALKLIQRELEPLLVLFAQFFVACFAADCMAIWMRCLVCMKNVPSKVVYTEPLNRGYANQFGWSSNGEHDKSAMHGNWDERKNSSELDIILVDWNELWMIADVRYRNKNNDSGSGEQKKNTNAMHNQWHTSAQTSIST